MARPSILGNHPPTEAEVNHALECCKAIPHIREELLAMEQEMSDIKESLGKAVSQNEQELYQFMLEEKEKKCQQKWESLEKLIRAIWVIPHANARAAVVGFYLDGICSKASHSMMSDNPHSGFYEASTSRTLDRSGGDPTCNQGGLCICEPVVCVDQGGGKSNCTVDEQVAPPLACTHGGAPAVAFTQNQRDEVRDLGDTAGSLSAQPGMKQQTFVAQPDDVTAFHVNQRNELIDLHGKSGALMATRSDQMQTFVLQGNMIGRKDENGPQGDGINEDVCFTLDATDRHAVCAPEDVYAMTTGSFMRIEENVSPTLMARDFKDPTTIAPVPHLNDGVSGTVATGAHPSGFNGQDAFNGRLVIDNPDAQPVPVSYTVRRLTPTECARLQGFPDWWCRDLETENPTEEEISFWRDVFETHRRLVTQAKKPKTEKQIRKWLADPYSDAAEYKLWGNGVALPCVFFVLSGIVWVAGSPENGSESE